MSAIRKSACMARSFMVGMPSPRSLPFFLGMKTRRRGSALYPRRLSDKTALNLSSGVFHKTWSTPGVCFPLFSVTRLTANAFAANERVSSRCNTFILPVLPSRNAFAIRNWSFLTLFEYTDHGIQLHDSCNGSLGAHASRAFFCVPKFERPPRFSCEERPVGSGPAFTVGDGTLSFPLQKGLCFFRHPLPACVSAGLAASFPRRNLRDAIGFTVFRIDDTNGEDAVFRPEASCPCIPNIQRDNRLHAFWPRPVSIFGLSESHDPCNSSHAFVLSVQPSPRTA